MLCLGNGIFVHGECKCYGGWKGKECSVAEGDCSDPTCGGNGVCVQGECLCSQGYKGEDCTEGGLLFPCLWEEGRVVNRRWWEGSIK